MRKCALTVVAAFWAVAALAGPDTESSGPAQAAADYLRTATKADLAFLPAGVLKPSFKAGELSGMLLFPADDVCVVRLTGNQVRQALEKSIAIYPSPNPGFLQLSGIVATFSKNADPSHRITSVTLSGANLENDKSYRVAMPGSLARGGLGYFTVWDKSAIAETLPNLNMGAVLKGKSGTEADPRWRVQG